MFLVQKFILSIIYPTVLCAVLLTAGLILLLFTQRQKLGVIFSSTGVLLLVFVSLNSVGDTLLYPLESKYPGLLDPLKVAEKEGDKNHPRWVVVLGGGYNFDPDLPITSRFSESTLHRLIEAIRLYRSLPEARLIFSGRNSHNGNTVGKGMRELARALGVEERAIVVEDRSRNTSEQVVFIRQIVKSDRFILVTSASHMPKAIEMFRKEGMDPIPGPANHYVKKDYLPAILRYIPSAEGLQKTRRAVYGYLGLAWEKSFGDKD